MTHENVQLTTLRRSILDDMFKDFDASRRWVRALLEPLAWPSAHRFAAISARFDATVARAGFREAMRELLADLVSDVEHDGREHIPEEGPLLIVSNHPGAYDSVAIAASLPRDDLQIIASNFPLLCRLPNASRHLIFTDPGAESGSNFSVVRSAIRHLRSGGALLIFPSGRVEPDPAVLPGALEALRAWSPSVEIFLRRVPDLKTQIAIVSGVLSPVFLRNPLIRFWKDIRDPQAIAEVTQVLTQMLFKWSVSLKPSISYGLPRTVEDLLQEGETLYQSVVDEAGRLLADHIQDFSLTKETVGKHTRPT
jgi:hypothetical protein